LSSLLRALQLLVSIVIQCFVRTIRLLELHRMCPSPDCALAWSETVILQGEDICSDRPQERDPSLASEHTLQGACT